MPKQREITASQYLEEVPKERRDDIARTRKLILEHLPKGYREMVFGNYLGYVVPLERYPGTYNKQPLGYLGLAAQKNYNALYLMGCYMKPSQQKRIEAAYRKAGKKLDMGKSCLRFGKYEELPHEVLGELIAELTPDEFIKVYEKSRSKTS